MNTAILVCGITVVLGFLMFDMYIESKYKQTTPSFIIERIKKFFKIDL